MYSSDKNHKDNNIAGKSGDTENKKSESPNSEINGLNVFLSECDLDEDDEFIIHTIDNLKRKKAYRNKQIRQKAPRPEIPCLALLAVIFFSVTAAIIFQSDRPTVSAQEKRTLTQFPELSVSSVTNGSYFNQLSLFFSDTFIGREKLVGISRRMDKYLGLHGSFSVISQGGAETEPTDTNDDELQKKLEEELQKLTSPVTEPVTEPTAAETEPVTEINPKLPEISLSQKEIKLPSGSTASIAFTVKDADGLELTAESDGDCAAVSISGQNLIISGAHEGTAKITVKLGDVYDECSVTVTAVKVSDNQEGADFISSGMFIYNGAVYTISGYGSVSVGYLSRCADYYKQLFPDTRISVLPAPVSAAVIDDPEITKNYTSQKSIFDNMQSRMSADINFVNIYDNIFNHRNDYLYFKSDHHWTQLGAYYAYETFARSVGFDPTPLGSMRFEVINDSYNGSMYSFTGDERVKEFIDKVEVHYPTKSASMTVTDRNGNTHVYNELILSRLASYQAFLAGDNPYTVINVPDNPQNLSILVLKDSFGNAFVPFLAEHYGNIIVVDPRYCDINLYDQFKDYGLTDILFVNNVQSQNSIQWSKYFFKCVGVDLDSLK